MNDFSSVKPRRNETPEKYALRLEKDGARELHIRKSLRAQYDIPMSGIIKACSALSGARHLELLDLRERFPDLNENRFAWKISKSLTIDKDAALVWAQTILQAEAGE
jgi:hypothetical protein